MNYKLMSYRGSQGTRHYCPDQNIYYGHCIMASGHVISYESKSLEELEAEFRSSLDSYLASITFM